MFERFTPGARTVVELAQAEAGALRHGYIGTEHLLLGLLGEHGLVAQLLRELGISAQSVRRQLQALIADPLITGPDAEALRAIGIDVEHVRARVEESFGPGALERARFGRCRRGLARGFTPMSPRTKKVLELALREALMLRHDHIGPEHILLALLREGNGLAARLLADFGVRSDQLRRSVLSALGQVA